MAGKRGSRYISGRGPSEITDPDIQQFYERLISIMNSEAGKNGSWHLLNCNPAWDGNPTHSHFVSYYISHPAGDLLVAVNYANYKSQCLVQLPNHLKLSGKIRLADHLSSATYDRDAAELLERGLFLDVEGFTAHIFSISGTIGL